MCVWVNLCIVTQIERADWPQETLYQTSLWLPTWRIRHVAGKGTAAAAAKKVGRPKRFALFIHGAWISNKHTTKQGPSLPLLPPLYIYLSNRHKHTERKQWAKHALGRSKNQLQLHKYIWKQLWIFQKYYFKICYQLINIYKYLNKLFVIVSYFFCFFFFCWFRWVFAWQNTCD